MNRNRNNSYAVKNIIFAIIFALLAGSIASFASAIFFIVMIAIGILALIFSILTLNKVPPVVSIIGFGVAIVAIILFFLVQEDGFFRNFVQLVTSLIIVFIGYLQRKKINEPYGRDGENGKTIQIFSYVLFFGIMGGGVLLFLGTLLKMVSVSFDIYNSIQILGMLACEVSAAVWVAYTIMVKKAADESGITLR